MAEKSTAVQTAQKTIADSVMNRVNELQGQGLLHLPKDYSAPNALQAAWLILVETQTRDKKPVLQACTKESVARSLLKMVVQGLNPVKRQCSFIAYGTELTCQREYQGTIAVAKRVGNVKSVNANVIYEADEFEHEIDVLTGRQRITKHKTSIAYMDPAKIVGAYAVVEFNDGKFNAEVMTMDQIKRAWMQGATKGESPAHKGFPDQMAKKTVINRACKGPISQSDDAGFFDDEEVDAPLIASQKAIAENANQGEEITIDFDHPEPVEAEEVNDEQPQGLAEQPKMFD